MDEKMQEELKKIETKYEKGICITEIPVMKFIEFKVEDSFIQFKGHILKIFKKNDHYKVPRKSSGKLSRKLLHNAFSICSDILKFSNEKNDKIHIRDNISNNQIQNLKETQGIIHSTPYKIENNKSQIDVNTLELLQKVEALNKKLDTLISDSTDEYEYPINTEQKIYNAWKKFYKNHPICGRAVGFMFATIITAIVAVFINNFLAKEEKCECNSCGQIQYVNEMTINYGY